MNPPLTSLAAMPDLSDAGAFIAAQLAAHPDKKPAELGAELAASFRPMLPMLPPPVVDLVRGFAAELLRDGAA